MALVIQKIKCQNTFPVLTDKPSWSVYNRAWNWYVTNKYQYSYDTVFCGHQYFRLGNTNDDISGYVRVSGEKVYLKSSNDCNKKEVTLYDFSLNIGDTVICGVYPSDSTKFWLTQIDTVTYSGIKRVRFKMKYYLGDPPYGEIAEMYWIKGIGSTTHPFYPMLCLSDNCEAEYALLCYHSGESLLYQDPSLATCDTSNVGIQKTKNNLVFLLAPNPFNTAINLSIKSQIPESVQVDIYNFSGEQLSSTKYQNTDEIQIGKDLQKGIYLLRAKCGNSYLIKKIVKVE